MHARIELPKAFSVRDEHEFFPIQHLMARLNPKLVVKQVATGVHVNGGCTVCWGIVYLDGQPPAEEYTHMESLAAAVTGAGVSQVTGAVVGDESRKYLWILSRTPQMDEAVYSELLKRVQAKGFDISKLEKNPQKPA